MKSMMYQAYQNHMDLTAPWRSGAASALSYLNLVPQGVSDKLFGRQRVTTCFFGDGAVAEGEFHESMNLAALWKLPVLFLCENNLYAMGTRIDRALAQLDLPNSSSKPSHISSERGRSFEV